MIDRRSALFLGTATLLAACGGKAPPVPLTEELTRRGETAVIQKVVNPPWTATASMLERNPDWPKSVPGGSPENPLGVRALYLGWPTYRIHGTQVLLI